MDSSSSANSVPTPSGPACSVLVDDPAILDRALVAGSVNWEQVRGEWALLCVPSLVPTYVERVLRLAQALGHPFKPEELPQLKELFRTKAQAGYEKSPYSRLLVRYGSATPPEKGLLWQLNIVVVSPLDQAQQFVSARPPEEFEAFPDAMVMDVATSLAETGTEKGGAQRSLSILDIGGGTGRNALALKSFGHKVTVLDSNGVMLDALYRRLAQLPTPNGVKVIEGSVLDDRILLPKNNFDYVILTGVLPYFSSLEELQQVFERVAIALKSGGQVLLDAFVASDGYEPTQLAQEMGRISDAMMFTPSMLDAAIAGTALTLVADADAWTYEMDHLSPKAKEARQWLESWALAQRIFALPVGQRPPISLRWLRYQKAA